MPAKPDSDGRSDQGTRQKAKDVVGGIASHNKGERDADNQDSLQICEKTKVGREFGLRAAKSNQVEQPGCERNEPSCFRPTRQSVDNVRGSADGHHSRGWLRNLRRL